MTPAETIIAIVMIVSQALCAALALNLTRWHVTGGSLVFVSQALMIVRRVTASSKATPGTWLYYIDHFVLPCSISLLMAAGLYMLATGIRASLRLDSDPGIFQGRTKDR